MNILRRTMSALLALVMVITMLPVSVLATETEPATVPEETASTGEVVLEIPETAETEAMESVLETVPASEPAEHTPEAAVPEETWEIGDIEVEETVATGEVIASGDCGENAAWTLDSEGLLTISGEGAMADYQSSPKDKRAPWNRYEKEIKKVVIEEGITYIGRYSLYHLSAMTDIAIAESVTVIGQNAFSNCTALTEFSIPNSITSIQRL